MAKKTQCTKSGRHSPADERRRAKVKAQVNKTSGQIGSQSKPDYTPKPKQVPAIIPKYDELPAWVILEAVEGTYRVMQVPGLVVEVIKDKQGASAIRIIAVPEGDDGYTAWKKGQMTYLPIHFIINFPGFVSKIPNENGRAVQQLIYMIFRPFVPMTKLSHSKPNLTLVPKTAPVEQPQEWSHKVADFYAGTPGHYAFPVKGPKAYFLIEEVANGTLYRLVSAEEGNPLHEVEAGTLVSHQQLHNEAQIPRYMVARGALVLKVSILSLFDAYKGMLKSRMFGKKTRVA